MFIHEWKGGNMAKTIRIETPRGLEMFVTLTQNIDRVLMFAEIPSKGISGTFINCHRMPKPKHGATYFIEIDYKTAVGLDDANAAILKEAIAEIKSIMNNDLSRSRK
jgi:hypothetical protein